MPVTYRFFTDSSADLTPKLQQETGIQVVPLSVKIEGRSYRNLVDESELPIQDFYQWLREGKQAVTSQVNAFEFVEAFRPVLEQGEDIFYLAFSTALSGTYNSFLIAQKELQEAYPQRKIIGVDSLCASLGQGLLAYLAVEKMREGFEIEELEEWVLNQRLKLVHFFTVDDLNHLKRGGRLSGGAAFIGTVLQLKPLLHVDDLGRLVAYGKVIGRKNALKQMVERMADRMIDPSEQTVFISHGDCLEEAEYVSRLIQDHYHVRSVVIGYVGPVIGAHAGPGTIAVFFLGDHR